MNSKVRNWTLIIVLNLLIAGAGVVAYTEFRADGEDDEENEKFEKDEEEGEEGDEDEGEGNNEQSSNQPPGPVGRFFPRESNQN